MQMRRYAFTGILAALLWPLWLGILGNPLLPVLSALPLLAAMLLALLFISTVSGIWVVDTFEPWSLGQSERSGLSTTLIRFSISLVATILFCIPLKMVLSQLTKQPFGYFETFSMFGLVVLGSVWFAALIVDLLVHQRNG